MSAIQTKYLPPTNCTGSRIKAFVSSDMGVKFSAVIHYDYSLSEEVLHFQAVKALVKKHNLPWDISKMAVGGVKGGYVFCHLNSLVGTDYEI